MLRVLVTAFPEQAEIWSVAVAVIVVASLVIGNLAALAQKSLKRLLAYSSVSQAGFMLIGVAANNELGAKGLLFYLIPYGAASIGAFAVVAARERELGREVTLGTLEGWGWERPFHGAAMWVFMLGFAGLPVHRRPRRQVLRLRRRLRGGLVVADRDRRHRDRGEHLLLPRRRARDVHAPDLGPGRPRRRRRLAAAGTSASTSPSARPSSSPSARSSSCSR